MSSNKNGKRNLIVIFVVILVIIVVAFFLTKKNAGQKDTKELEQNDGKVEQPDITKVEKEPSGESETNVNAYYQWSGLEENDETVAAMFFLGYGEEASKLMFESFCAEYEFDKTQVEIVNETTNQEYYLIIPKYQDAKITISRVELDEVGTLQTKETLIETDKPVFLCCNTSDIIPSTLVSIVSKEGSAEFSPFISLENGKVATEDFVYTDTYVGEKSHKD